MGLSAESELQNVLWSVNYCDAGAPAVKPIGFSENSKNKNLIQKFNTKKPHYKSIHLMNVNTYKSNIFWYIANITNIFYFHKYKYFPSNKIEDILLRV